MRFHRLAVLTFALGFILSISAYADTGKQEAMNEAVKELKNQTVCPVMGGKIDSTVYTDIQGQRVYHCCSMCSNNLKAEPDKFFKKAEDAGVLFENIQTTCPVSGEKLEGKTVFSDYDGRRVYFCCKKCRGTFAEAPAKYLGKMDAPIKANNDPGQNDHQSHDHN